MRPEIKRAIRLLQAQCHTIVPQIHDDILYFEIDGHLLASWEEIQHIIDGMYTIGELEELHSKRGEAAVHWLYESSRPLDASCGRWFRSHQG